MKFLGPHVSCAGGLYNAPDNAAAVGASGFALFTKNQRQWIAPALTDDEIARFRTHCERAGIPQHAILPHDSYLINLGNPDEEKRANARRAFTEELRRVEALGLTMLNFHPGSGLGADRHETLRNIARCVQQSIDETEHAIAVIENTAGQGNVAGASLEELAELIALIDRPARVGICIDTCHAWTAGIALNNEDGYEAFWQEFESRIGMNFLRGMHLNDAKAGCGSHLDRHETLGAGKIGWWLFERLVADPRIDDIPMILETPNPDKWADEIAHLKSVMK